MNKYFKDYTIIDAYKSVIRAFEMLRKPGIVFTEEQKKKIAEFVERDKNDSKRV